jgi:UDP-glucuronate 4-epimerase
MEIILVTGGAGFIGSNLINKLLENDQYKIICVDDFNDFYDPKLKRNNVKNNFNNKNFNLIECDIRNHELLKNIFINNKIDTIIHLAARAGVRPSIINPKLYNEVNIDGTLNLLELAKEFAIKNFIFGSSSSVYGNYNNLETLHEELPVNKPISPYAMTKSAGEQLCYTYHKLYNINIVCLRFFTVYGPRQRPDLAIYKFTNQISKNEPIEVYGNGETMRDYTYVSDIVSGIILAINYNKTGYEIINLGGGKPVKLNDLINIIEKNLEKKAIFKNISMQLGDVNFTNASTQKAKELLGYEAIVNIENGISNFIKWYNKINYEKNN